MNLTAIEVKNLSKLYNIGHERKGMKGTATLRDAITNFVRKPTELITGHRLRKEHFWALKDINFEIQQGDVVGIIGKNGSGKSTLLKILSQIVEPTAGEIHMRGKVASLLEVGTGFHPELTGRENIFFNGAILGMKRKEIIAKFDDIVAFSEVEQFLDTPVKFYSSGMYVRLAFAVAAHLDPDILIVDEVLAVGDAAFQKKSLGKMSSVAKEGRTVLFVSHSMSAIEQLCTQAILLEEGVIKYSGPTKSVIDHYMKKSKKRSLIYERAKNKPYQILSVKLTNDSGKETNETRIDEDIFVQIEYVLDKPLKNCIIACDFYSSDGTPLFATTDSDQDPKVFLSTRETGRYLSTIKLPSFTLIDKTFYLQVNIQTPHHEVYDSTDELFFDIISTDSYKRTEFTNSSFGYLSLPLNWETKKI
jgi:lipopolysaccharide transport system ATP-binding protein